MPEDNRIRPDTNLCKLPSGVFQKVTQYIQISGMLKKLLALGDGTRYQLGDVARHEVIGTGCEMIHMTNTERLFTIWGNLGMTVIELATALKMLKMERPLLLLIDRESLVLDVDIPQELEVEEGGILQLQCSAHGFPFPKYCWYQGKELRVQNTSGVLEVLNVGLNDTGPYVCRIHNSLNHVKDVIWTGWCKVHVKERLIPLEPMQGEAQPSPVPYPQKPHILRQPEAAVAVELGKPFQLRVEACGEGPLRYTWCRNREICMRTSSQNFINIPSAEPRHRGKYQCTISNQHGELKTDVCCVKVKIESIDSDVPHIKSEPTDKQDCVGGHVLFNVEASSSQKLRFKWYHNNVEIQDACEPELRIDIKSQAQGGWYQCTVSTEAGSKITRQAKLTILRRPKTFHYYATDKVALIFGQSSYRANFKPLPAVKNDIYDAYTVFTELGFKTLSFLDSTLQEMKRAVNMACDLMRGEGNSKLYVVLYFLGHGFMFQGNHYLMPHDAQEGTQVSRCLCIEEVEKEIQKELDPELMFMILDTCKKEQKNVMPETLPPPSQTPVCKKKFVFYAASCGEESCEEQVQETSDGNRVTSTKHKVRGIFSRDLLGTIRKSRKLRMCDIYQAFTDTFGRPDPVIDKKVQNPECHMNIEEYDRSLGDQINNEGQEEEYVKRLNKWKKLNVVPANQIIHIEQNIWYLETSWRQRGSNVLEVTIEEVDKRFSESIPNVQVTFTLVDDLVPPVVKPPEEIPQEGKKKKYILFNLQRLESNLVLTWKLELKQAGCCESNKHEARQDYGLPLIAQIWNVTPYKPEPDSRVACEHFEDCQPSSMESNC